MQQVKRTLLSILVMTFGVVALAQYPSMTKEEKEKGNEMVRSAREASDKAWEKALPIVEKEAREGKPYIPWAGRPTDLPQAEIPSFPGAQGGGMYSFGGRGGRTIVVTNLNDSGPGSFRDACEQGGARVIVFNVAGIIKLETPLIIRAPYATIVGNTAPGDGVCIAGETVWIDGHDIVIRHMRFRRGDTFVGRRDDAIGGNPVGNIMIDHVSASWGLDENMSIYRHMWSDGTGKKDLKLPTVNITIQNSIFSEALDTYNHSFGSTLGGENCSFHRNLWANNTGRNPSIGWNGIFNFTNNVVYNWKHRSVDGGDYTALFNIINNYYKPGPVTQMDDPVGQRILNPESGRSNLGYKEFGRVYANGNIMEGNDKVTKDNWDGGIQVEDENDTDLWDAGKYTAAMKWHKPFPMAPVDIIPADEAFDYVLENAGATLPKRDPVDVRVTKTVRTNEQEYVEGLDPDDFYQFKYRRLPADSWKMGIITDIAQVGGYPEYKGKPYKDSDSDGMPDSYEKKVGLNPKDASDSMGDLNGDGYTNIEMYIYNIDPKSKVDWTDPSNNKDTLAK
ncbi:MAG: polysaccharide lyase [Cyclobacteriaceae bacterium]